MRRSIWTFFLMACGTKGKIFSLTVPESDASMLKIEDIIILGDKNRAIIVGTGNKYILAIKLNKFGEFLLKAERFLTSTVPFYWRKLKFKLIDWFA